MAGITASSNDDLTTGWTISEPDLGLELGLDLDAEDAEDGKMGFAVPFLLAFCALRSVARVSFRSMRSNSSL